ncbi:transposase [Paenibacillus sp. GCM10027626]|uniref:transposase n=1 Tax=Paenibacillus sp. GCM10027626 TaxID=3273411 RepID=UPI003643C0C0
MAIIRNRDASKLKTKLILEMIEENESISYLASRHGINDIILDQWKKKIFQNLLQLIDVDSKINMKMKNDYEKKISVLYAEIGKLTTQISLLKKKVNH